MTDAEAAGASAIASKPDFLAALDACLAARRTDGRGLALLAIRCPLITEADAAWGRPVGDAVRERLADALRGEVLRETDLLGSFGRDELSCLLATVDDPSVPQLAAEKMLRVISTPVFLGDEEVYPAATIGIASAAQTDDLEPGMLLQQAQCACLDALRQGSTIGEYSPASAGLRAARLIEQSRLRAAIQDDTLELLYQPRFDLRLGPMVATQIHLCWQNPAEGLISAQDAFAAAQDSGNVANLLSSILNRTLRNISEFRYRAGLDLMLGIQLPATALQVEELPDVVERALGTWRLRPGRLIFQVGAMAALARHPALQETLLRLKKVGVLLGIDDPALELGGLGTIAALPFQFIRLDFAGMPLDAAEAPAGNPPANNARPDPVRALSGALVELAHRLGWQVIGSGAADEAAAGRLKAMGCDYLQADFMGPPLDADAFVARFG